MPETDERSPLLLQQVQGSHGPVEEPDVSPFSNDTLTVESDISESQSKVDFDVQLRHFLRTRFWWFCVLGVAAVITLQLFFLPRTSLSRDFRRWHDLHLTKTDAKRIFLAQLNLGRPDKEGLSNEQHIEVWLKKFAAINGKTPTSLAGAPELATFVESQMRSFGFQTECKMYPVLENLRTPLGLTLQLLDSKSGRSLYNAPLAEPKSLTPAFFTYGKSGTVKGDFLYAHAGAPGDYDLLAANGISPANKIVVISQPLSSEYLVADKVAYAELLGCAAVVVFGDAETETAVSRNYKPLHFGHGFRLPVSFKAIRPILEAMGSPSAPFTKWEYSPTPEKSLQLKLTTEFALDSLNATNIVATVQGVLHDGEIVIGAARDSFTSSNPMSGHAVMFEVMRGLQNLKKLGWRPLRSIRFVSWDASRSGLQGSLEGIRDAELFKKNLPVLAYINLDEDVVTGSHFTVDSNPLFNHILKSTARIVPFPKASPFFKRLGEDDSGDDDGTSLYHYWHKQDKANINNRIGNSMAFKDAGTFQFAWDTPSINIRFTESPSYNDSIYVPESNFYSYEWLTKENVDKSFELHGLLVRFLGLLVLSLGEHEVVDSRTNAFFGRMQDFFEDFKRENNKTLESWGPETVPVSLLSKYSIYTDLASGITIEANNKVSFATLLSQMDSMINATVYQSRVFDDYNREVEDSLTRDFPWYKMLKKVHIYAKFKVTNYKLLRFEKEMALRPEDFEYLGLEPSRFHHLLYGAPSRVVPYTKSQKDCRGAFGPMYSAVENDEMKQLVKLMAVCYERLLGIYRRIA